MSATRLHGGMALVESLVAITLLGIGLGGSAALLVQAIGNEREATLRAMALRHANSLADELRAVLRDHGLPIALAEVTAAGCPGPDGTCTLDQWIAWRVADWQRAALADLPEGSVAVVELLDASSPAYRVTLSWPGSDAMSPTRVELVVEP